MDERKSIRTKNGKLYAVLAYKDEYGFSRQKWIHLDLPANSSQIEAQKIANQKFAEYEAEKQKLFANKPQKRKKRYGMNISFAKFINLWLNSIKKNVQIDTYDDYLFEIKNIKDYFSKFATEKLTIRDILPLHISGFYNFLHQKGLSNNTISHYHVLFNQIFKFAVKNDVLPFNIMDKVDRPKKEKYEPKYYSASQVANLLEILKNSNFALKIPIMLTCIYGLRRSEVVGLLWSSVDFENKIIHINHKVIETNKNGKVLRYASKSMKNETSKRELPLLPQVEELLLSAKQDAKNNKAKYSAKYENKYADYVCVDKFGKLITPHRITTGFAKFLKKNKLPKIRFHDLRHSCASMLVQNGVSMKAIQEWLGHANFNTTANIYSHLDYSSKLKSGAKIEQLLYGKELPNEMQQNDDSAKDGFCKNTFDDGNFDADIDNFFDLTCDGDGIAKFEKIPQKTNLSAGLAEIRLKAEQKQGGQLDKTSFFEMQTKMLLAMQKLEKKIDFLSEQTEDLAQKLEILQVD